MPPSPEQLPFVGSPRIISVQNRQEKSPNFSHQGDPKRLSLSPSFSLSNRNNLATSDMLKSPVRSPRGGNMITVTDAISNPARTSVNMDVKHLPNIEDSPQLLATSVGAEIGSELVPSISNISLLSLNQLNSTPASLSNNNIPQNLNPSYNVDSNLSQEETAAYRSNSFAQRHFNNQRQPNLPPIQHSTFSVGGSRKSSFHSPTLTSSPYFNSASRPRMRRQSSNVSHQQQSFSIASFVKNKPNQTTTRRKTSTGDMLYEPDSPSLDPVSLSGSPSNFMLTQTSPPSSLKSNSLLSSTQFPLCKNTFRSSNTRKSSLSMLNSNVSQLKLLVNNLTDEQSFYQIPMNRNDSSSSIGRRSPELRPVNATLPPMTPLNLSAHDSLSGRSNSVAIIDDDEEEEEGYDEETTSCHAGNTRKHSINKEVSGIRNNTESQMIGAVGRVDSLKTGDELTKVSTDKDDIFGQNIED